MVQATGIVAVFETFPPENVITSIARVCWTPWISDSTRRVLCVTEIDGVCVIGFVFPTPPIDCQLYWFQKICSEVK
jgi:hypothetical protein